MIRSKKPHLKRAAASGLNLNAKQKTRRDQALAEPTARAVTAYMWPQTLNTSEESSGTRRTHSTHSTIISHGRNQHRCSQHTQHHGSGGHAANRTGCRRCGTRTGCRSCRSCRSSRSLCPNRRSSEHCSGSYGHQSLLDFHDKSLCQKSCYVESISINAPLGTSANKKICLAHNLPPHRLLQVHPIHDLALGGVAFDQLLQQQAQQRGVAQLNAVTLFAAR